MTPEQITKWADESGYLNLPVSMRGMELAELTRFAELVAQHVTQNQPEPSKMHAALQAIANGTVKAEHSGGHLATVLAYQTLARQAIETDAERMAGARAKHDDSYPSDLLARAADAE
jgi:hypothetical protein